MSGSINLAFFESSTVGLPGSLENILSIFNTPEISLSYIRVGSWATELFAYWKTYDEKTNEELHIAYEKQELTFLFSENRNGPEQAGIIGHIYIRWKDSSSKRSKMPSCFLKLNTDSTAMFTQKKYDSEENCERLLELATKLYNAYCPKYGWIERGLLSGYTTKEDIKNATIPHIYWVNFFGPEYVERYGSSYFENAPGWLGQSLDNDGYLYVLSPDVNRNKAGIKELEQEVKDYFGVSEVRKKKKARRK